MSPLYRPGLAELGCGERDVKIKTDDNTQKQKRGGNDEAELSVGGLSSAAERQCESSCRLPRPCCLPSLFYLPVLPLSDSVDSSCEVPEEKSGPHVRPFKKKSGSLR